MSTLDMGLVLGAIDVYKAGYIPDPTNYVNMSHQAKLDAKAARSGDIAHNNGLFDELLAVVENNLVILDREATVEEIADIKRIVKEGVSYEAVSDTVAFVWVLKQIDNLVVTPKMTKMCKFYISAVIDA